MRNVTVLATGLILASSTFAFAVPAQIGAPVQSSTMAESFVAQVAQTKAKKVKKSKQGSKTEKKNMNMPGMPPGHKM